MTQRNRKSSEASAGSVLEVDEERVRRIARDNPDVLHTRLAQRFGISVSRFRRIIGWHLRGELLTKGERSTMRYTPRPGGYREATEARQRYAQKRDHVRAQIRAQERRRYRELPPKGTQ